MASQWFTRAPSFSNNIHRFSKLSILQLPQSTEYGISFYSIPNCSRTIQQCKARFVSKSPVCQCKISWQILHNAASYLGNVTIYYYYYFLLDSYGQISLNQIWNFENMKKYNNNFSANIGYKLCISHLFYAILKTQSIPVSS